MPIKTTHTRNVRPLSERLADHPWRNEGYLLVAEVAEKYQVSPVTVQGWCSRGHVVFRRYGKWLFVSEASVRERQGLAPLE